MRKLLLPVNKLSTCCTVVVGRDNIIQPMGVDESGELVPMKGLEEAKSESDNEAESEKEN